ncbi:MAG: tryptophan synthase subunit alpha [Candidatus Omnitrophica bacterium]|nr:tryptophan synthase subunit alpha [Candidatus Omnitrophota bacterium]
MTLKEKFEQLKKENRKAFIVYIPFGFPNIEYTNKIILTLQDVGVDIIELGIPFSDPIADGPIIQEATATALKNGANIKRLFSQVRKIKNKISIPTVLMSYYNPIFRFGVERFFSKMKELDISGILTVDLPCDEDKNYLKEVKRFGLEPIFLVTPTTTLERAKKITKNAKGFIYYVSITGVTGPKVFKFDDIKNHIQNLKKLTSLPVCIGFGIHKLKQIKKILAFSDGVIIGSYIVKFIKENYKNRFFLRKLKNYIKFLCMK